MKDKIYFSFPNDIYIIIKMITLRYSNAIFFNSQVLNWQEDKPLNVYDLKLSVVLAFFPIDMSLTKSPHFIY